VSRGEVVSINNFYCLFKDLLTPVQLNGLRFLLTPFPQEEFNWTDDRKSSQPSLGVTCLDCYVKRCTTGQFQLNPDDRPQERRMRLDRTGLRGMFNQQIHGSKRNLRSVEDFTEFEQRTAYFNGDPIHAMKKGIIILDRVRVSHLAQMQDRFDLPPAPKLNSQGRLDPAKATESERRGRTFERASSTLLVPSQQHTTPFRSIPRVPLAFPFNLPAFSCYNVASMHRPGTAPGRCRPPAFGSPHRIRPDSRYRRFCGLVLSRRAVGRRPA
jgi:hypothetical protein